MSQAPYGPTPATPPPWPPQAAPARRGASQLLAILGLVLGLLGLGIGTAAWFRAAPKPAATTYSDQQVAEAKQVVCEAYAKGVRSLRIAGNRKVDSLDALPIAVNTRLAEVTVGNYLINSVDANPAAPPELKDLIDQLAHAYQDIALAQLADASTEDYKPIGLAADKVIAKIDQICP